MIASFAFIVNAVTYMQVKTDDGKVVRYDVKHVTEVNFEEDTQETELLQVTVSGTIGKDTYVDLGLPSGTKWLHIMWVQKSLRVSAPIFLGQKPLPMI